MRVKMYADGRGFTLIELVMIIVVIGILTAVALPKYANVGVDAEQAICHGKQGAIHAVIAVYFAQNRSLPDSLTGSMFASGVVPVCPGSGAITYTNVGDSTYTLTCSVHGNPDY